VFLTLPQERAAHAAETDGFALNRFEPAERGSDWFALESLDLRGHGRWATGVVGDWSHRPLVLYDDAGNEVRALLRDQLYAYVGGSIVWFDRLRVSASFPLLLVNDVDAATPQTGNLDIASGANLGDLRMSGDVRVLAARITAAAIRRTTDSTPTTTAAATRVTSIATMTVCRIQRISIPTTRSFARIKTGIPATIARSAAPTAARETSITMAPIWTTMAPATRPRRISTTTAWRM
jgi:hypothetical protein